MSIKKNAKKKTLLRGKHVNCVHFTDENTEAERVKSLAYIHAGGLNTHMVFPPLPDSVPLSQPS